ncbi:MAG: LytTR family DNA-binding domain-containing protein [Prevotellaceae bacterium]|jgi:DNA-binding LytR/AlgR family response regulator|nr:LytTR family DNA-binding domain-containing protein [Prevotellaceae bacterium]
MQVLIIEDEKKAARNLADMLTAIDNTIQVVAMIESVEQGLRWFKEHASPDLIFSDIQLSDGLSFLIYEEIRVEAPIIFCTAYDEYLLQAFNTTAVSYLLKPVNKEQVEAALEKVGHMQRLFQKNAPERTMEKLLAHLDFHYKTALLVNQGDKIIPLKMADIACFYLDGHALALITFRHQKYYYASSLDEIQKLISPALFYRANRQFIVNRNAVVGIERYFTRRLVVKLSVDTPEKMIISKTKSTAFLEWLEGN